MVGFNTLFLGAIISVSLTLIRVRSTGRLVIAALCGILPYVQMVFKGIVAKLSFPSGKVAHFW